MQEVIADYATGFPIRHLVKSPAYDSPRLGAVLHSAGIAAIIACSDAAIVRSRPRGL